MSIEYFSTLVLRDVLTGTIETRISKLQNQEAKKRKRKTTRTVKRHNTETGEMKLMVRKHQKISKNFSQDTQTASMKSNYKQLQLQQTTQGELSGRSFKQTTTD